MQKEEEEERYSLLPRAEWFLKLISFQADIIYNCIVSLLSPFIALFSIASNSYHHAEEATASVESAVLKVPYKLTRGTTLLLRKIGSGVLAALHMCMVLMVVMLVAVVLGVGLVRVWVEEPMLLRERMFFDYTEVNPKAVFSFDRESVKKSPTGVSIGHTFQVSLQLLMPESDYNREIGVFQLTAELLSANGNVIAKSSQPCMLRFRSFPIRLLRTFLMGVPLVLGISEETQKISVEILKHKEGYPRSKAIRVTLSPRAGTSYLPQLYEAEMVLKSQLPWTKEVVRKWKWTFYIWTSLYIYLLLVVLVILCCRPLVLPMTTVNFGYGDDHVERDLTTEGEKWPRSEAKEGREISEFVRNWQRGRRKRKAIYLHEDAAEAAGSSAASTMSHTREDTSAVIEEDIGDSGSVCLGG